MGAIRVVSPGLGDELALELDFALNARKARNLIRSVIISLSKSANTPSIWKSARPLAWWCQALECERRGRRQ